MKSASSPLSIDIPKDWRETNPELEGLGAKLRKECREVLPAWGDPVAASEYHDTKDVRRFVTADFANGMRLSMCYRYDGWQVAYFDIVGPV